MIIDTQTVVHCQDASVQCKLPGRGLKGSTCISDSECSVDEDDPTSSSHTTCTTSTSEYEESEDEV